MTQTRVLLLEFDAVLCDLIKLTLNRTGFTTAVCTDPMLIRNEISEFHPEVVIIDSKLPGINAIDLLNDLKTESLLENVHVILLSNLGFSCIVTQAAAAGVDDFIVKPFTIEALLSKVQSHQ